jgi:hypothetical protein
MAGGALAAKRLRSTERRSWGLKTCRLGTSRHPASWTSTSRQIDENLRIFPCPPARHCHLKQANARKCKLYLPLAPRRRKLATLFSLP